MAHTVITVGREYGSGGRLIAQKAAEALGIPFFDRSIINMAAEETGLSADFIRRTEQQKTSSFLYNLYMSTQSLPVNDQVFIAQSEVIRRVAAEGPCIIVGRGADYILRDREDVLNVFLYADQADKLAYAMDTYGDRPEEAEQRVRQVDASRESYYHYLTRAKWGDLKRYHLSLNTSPIGKEGGADLIVQYAKLRRAKLGL